MQALAEACLEEAGKDSDGSCFELWSAGDIRVEGIVPSWTLVMLPLLLFNVVQFTLRVYGLVHGTACTRTRRSPTCQLMSRTPEVEHSTRLTHIREESKA